MITRFPKLKRVLKKHYFRRKSCFFISIRHFISFWFNPPNPKWHFFFLPIFATTNREGKTNPNQTKPKQKTKDGCIIRRPFVLFTGVTILLSLTVFHNIVTETLPQVSDAMPLLGTFSFQGRSVQTKARTFQRANSSRQKIVQNKKVASFKSSSFYSLWFCAPPILKVCSPISFVSKNLFFFF